MSTTLLWTPATRGFDLALDGTVLRCRKTSGQVLASVPAAVRTSPVGAQLTDLRERLLRHEAQCRSTVESWLLAGVAVPAVLLARVWPDPGWRTAVANLVVTAAGRTGLLADVSATGTVTLDNTAAFTVDAVTLLHPVLLTDPDRWRQVLDARQATQGVAQLARQVHHRPSGTDPHARSVDDFAGAEFEQLRHATALAAREGFVIRGGSAAVRIAGGAGFVEARYWLGADDPGLPATTGRLCWVDAGERTVALGDVSDVAWSEGVRMATLIHAGRKTDEH